MKLLAVVALVGAVGCGDNLVDSNDLEQSVGAENCATTVDVASTGAVVAVTVDEGFNAWKNNDPSLTLSGSSTTCTGTVQFTVSSAGAWTFTPGNQSCSTDYAGSANLAVAANHWHNVVHCDNSVEIVGCQGDAAYTAAVFIDGPGPNDFSTTVSGTVGAVQDADVVDVCAGECPIGPCVSACEASCAQGDTDCGQCCECQCKEEGLEAGNDACQPQDLCFSGSEGHAVCLPSQQP